MRPLRILTFLFLMLLIAGCSLPLEQFIAEPSSTPVNTTLPELPTMPPFPEPVITVLPSETPPQQEQVTIITESAPDPADESVVQPTAFTPFNVSVWAEGVKLRTNPGYLFPASRLLSSDVRIQVLGRSPGNEWIYVLGPNNTYGWVFAQLIESDTDLKEAPLVEPGNVQILRGSLTTPDGQPINGIQFAITQGSQRTDAMTAADGTFIAFLPLDVTGTWQVSYTAVSCTSNTMDADCNCLGGVCGQPIPNVMTITLPTEETIQFTWE